LKWYRDSAFCVNGPTIWNGLSDMLRNTFFFENKFFFLKNHLLWVAFSGKSNFVHLSTSSSYNTLILVFLYIRFWISSMRKIYWHLIYIIITFLKYVGKNYLVFVVRKQFLPAHKIYGGQMITTGHILYKHVQI
jgi:hypothetical protein